MLGNKTGSCTETFPAVTLSSERVCVVGEGGVVQRHTEPALHALNMNWGAAEEPQCNYGSVSAPWFIIDSQMEIERLCFMSCSEAWNESGIECGLITPPSCPCAPPSCPCAPPLHPPRLLSDSTLRSARSCKPPNNSPRGRWIYCPAQLFRALVSFPNCPSPRPIAPRTLASTL